MKLFKDENFQALTSDHGLQHFLHVMPEQKPLYTMWPKATQKYRTVKSCQARIDREAQWKLPKAMLEGPKEAK
jgi:hypothetical protein